MEIDKPIAISFMLFLTLVLVFYLVIPQYKLFQSSLIEIGTKEADLQAKDAYFIEITKTYRELIQRQDSLDKIEAALPDKLSLSSLINFLYQKSAEKGLIIKRVSILQSKSSNNTENSLKEAVISLNLFGSYTAFEQFLFTIEESSRLIESQDFSFSVTPSSTENQTTQETYPIRLNIKVYSY
jgi:Tfp pilus assembly protein PilO